MGTPTSLARELSRAAVERVAQEVLELSRERAREQVEEGAACPAKP